MPINPHMITLAREARELTQSDLAKILEVTKSTVCRWELGELSASGSIRSIAAALRFDATFFEQHDPVYALGGDFLYRRRATLGAKIKRRVQAECNIRKMQLERLSKSAEVVDPVPLPAMLTEDYGPADRIARSVRDALRIPRGPISNLTGYLERAGIMVFVIDFGSDMIDGTNIRVPGVPPMMFLNRNVSGERHRFNLAHELGHLVMHFGAASPADVEDEANDFASEFLMPRALIRDDLKNLKLPSAMRLKPIWGASMQALIMRAFRLNLITESQRRTLMIQIGAAGARTVEPLPLPFEQPEAFEKLMRFHRDELGLSEAEMMKLLFTESLGVVEIDRGPRLSLWGDS